MAEFKSWPSITRLLKDVVVTEKLDGTNAAIHVERLKADLNGEVTFRQGDVISHTSGETTFLRLTAQSRTRIITPKDDNFGFAAWVADHASSLAAELGEGIHYGEWWGYKIGRGYGLPKGDKRFSLFNTERWSHLQKGSQSTPGLYCVPLLSTGSLLDPEVLMSEDVEYNDVLFNPVSEAVAKLREEGSVAAPGYLNPEGIVVFHTAARTMFKYTLDGDGHKSEVKPVTPDHEREPLQTRLEQIKKWLPHEISGGYEPTDLEKIIGGL